MLWRQGCLLPRKSREETTEVGARTYRKSKKKTGDVTWAGSVVQGSSGVTGWASAIGVNGAGSKRSSPRWRVRSWGAEADPDPADPPCLPSHSSLGTASGLMTAPAPSLTAKPQLPFVCLSQETIASNFEDVCTLLAESLCAQLKISEEADPEED